MNKIEEIANNFTETTIQDVIDSFYSEADTQLSPSMLSDSLEIKQLIEKIIVNAEKFQSKAKLLSSVGQNEKIAATYQKIELEKEMIYNDFFKLQNLMNAFLGQKIIVTYVSKDEITGERTIQLINNDIAHIEPQLVTRPWGSSYVTAVYQIQDQYQELKNSLSDKENQGLKITANEVEARYEKYRRRILWKINNEWYGYRLTNRGPINEAYVAFYIHEIQLNNSLNQNIHNFMTSSAYGVIQADNANGFFIGDTSIGGLQFAVKGAHGGPQKWTKIVADLKKIKEQNYSQASFNNFITSFKELEKEKATSLVKPMTQRQISAMVRYHGNKILKPISKGVQIF